MHDGTVRDVSFQSLVAVFLKTGNLTFGGGDPAMAAFERELVERRGWLTAEQFGLAFALARVTPGTNVLACAAALGWQLRGWAGASAAVLAASMPSSLLALLLLEGQEWLARHGGGPALAGIAAGVVGLMYASAWLLARPLRRVDGAGRVALFAGAAWGLSQIGWTPLPILAVAALAGYFWPGGDR